MKPGDLVKCRNAEWTNRDLSGKIGVLIEPLPWPLLNGHKEFSTALSTRWRVLIDGAITHLWVDDITPIGNSSET